MQSVLAQTLPPHSVTIVENCSTDRTRDVAERLVRGDPRVRLEVSRGCGESRARNRGIDLSRGADLVAFLDADDRWRPHLLERLVARLDSLGPAFGVAHADYSLIGEDGSRLQGRTRTIRHEGDIFRPLLLDCYAVAGSMSGAVIRASVLEAGLRFDEDLHFAGDWDFWLRVARCWRFTPVREPLTEIRIHGDSLQQRARRDHRTRLDRLAIELDIMSRHRDAVAARDLGAAMRQRAYVHAFSIRRHPLAALRLLRASRAVIAAQTGGEARLVRNAVSDVMRLSTLR